MGQRAAPGVGFFQGREDGLLCLLFLFDEPLQVEELFGHEIILQLGQPALVERINLQLEQLLLLGWQAGNPGILIERHLLGRTQEGGDAAIDLRLLAVGGQRLAGLALEAHGVDVRAEAFSQNGAQTSKGSNDE